MENYTKSSDFSSLATTVLPALSKNANKIYFSWYDYILFSIMLVLSGGIGVYYGCFAKKQSTAKEYLMGGKKMKVIPIAISLVASHTSGITLLALPADVYTYGATYWLGAMSMLILFVLTVYVYLPVFYNLQLTSTYEYLGKRFDRKTRKCASFLFALSVFLYLPIVIYIPALAFSAATGIDVHIVTPVVCSVCIFYTTLGGLKALVLSDSLQFSMTCGAMLTIFYLGIKAAGGFATMWQTAVAGKRLDIFDFDLDLTKRESFWSILVGLTVHWVAHTSVNQGCTQKFLSVATLRESKQAVFLYCFGMVIMKTLSVMSGLIMYSLYAGCDPLTSGKVEKNDQLLPYYVMDVAGSIPGLSGLFIAGIFSAALSTLSGNLNCLAGTIYEDFVRSWYEKKFSNKSASYILKILVVIIGVISTLMVYVVEHLGGLLSLAIGLGSVAHGPLVGLFTLGLLYPKANGNGAFYGALASVAIMGPIITGANYYKGKNMLNYPKKPISVDQCLIPINQTISALNYNPDNSGVFLPFRISFYWYTLMGGVVQIVVGVIISHLTAKKNDPKVPRELLSPVIHRFLPDEDLKEELAYYSVKDALEKVTDERKAELDEENLKQKLRKMSYVSEVFDD